MVATENRPAEVQGVPRQDWPNWMNTSDAARYLQSLGVPRKSSTLAKLRVDGTGPLYHRCGRTPLYMRQHLDQWAEEMLGAPVRSTSEAAKLREASDGA